MNEFIINKIKTHLAPDVLLPVSGHLELQKDNKSEFGQNLWPSCFESEAVKAIKVHERHLETTRVLWTVSRLQRKGSRRNLSPEALLS